LPGVAFGRAIRPFDTCVSCKRFGCQTESERERERESERDRESERAFG